ncbi:hypothetical protein BM1_04417 [Bipolaris maydis]|nr:hypothetical protein BM1_04417 [Bipolaris maydis]
MPRRLPWAKKDAAGAKAAIPYSDLTSRTYENDDDFLEDVIAASSSKGNRQANQSDDDLPNLPAEPSTPGNKSRRKDAWRKGREVSSSPPPLAEDLEQPRVEYMHGAISKFDLRDDEWMMVEDEFLETAKLFTRHLHIAEYEKLKEMIEEKKKGADAPRPVVPNAKMSDIGAMKDRAKVQEQKQKRALQDVFASQDDDEAQEQRSSLSTHVSRNLTTLPHAVSKRALGGTAKQQPVARGVSDSDSEDLDTVRPPAKPALKAATSAPSKISSSPSRPISASTPSLTTKLSSPIFTKPALPPTYTKPTPPPTPAKPRSRTSLAKPFDMLDDWIPSKSQPSPKVSLERPSIQPLTSPTPVISKPTRSFDSIEMAKPSLPARSASSSAEMGAQQISSGGSVRSKDVAERLAKRKAEREKKEGEKEKKRRTVDVDDIPTFLF